MSDQEQTNSPAEHRPAAPGADGRRGRGTRPPRRRGPDQDRAPSEFNEKVLFINRSSKVVKGGRRFSFSALVVAGDRKGRVGLGLGKANEVADSIRKATENAKSRMTTVALNGSTIPHDVLSVYDGARVLLRPASAGTGVIAGKVVRAVLEAAGVKDILTKSLGSKNAANVAKATLSALHQLRRREEIYRQRGLRVKSAEPAAEATAGTVVAEAAPVAAPSTTPSNE